MNCCGGSGRPSPFGVGGSWWSAGQPFHGRTLMVGWQLPSRENERGSCCYGDTAMELPKT